MTAIEELTKSIQELNQQFDILLGNIHRSTDSIYCPVCGEAYDDDEHLKAPDNTNGPCLACAVAMEDKDNANEIHREFNYE